MKNDDECYCWCNYNLVIFVSNSRRYIYYRLHISGLSYILDIVIVGNGNGKERECKQQVIPARLGSISVNRESQSQCVTTEMSGHRLEYVHLVIKRLDSAAFPTSDRKLQ